MQLGTAVSSPPNPFDASSGASASTASATLASLQRQHRQSKRSTSLSSGSITTVTTRPNSLHRNRSDSTSHDSMSHGHRRRRSVAIDSSEPHYPSDSPGLSTTNRWSHSTTSSFGSNTRRNRSSSGAVLSSLAAHSFSPRQKPLTALDASPRATPHRRNVTSGTQSLTGSPSHSRRASRNEHVSTTLTALPPLHTTPSLTDPNDTESPSTPQTVPTPSIPSDASNNYFHDDDTSYPYTMAKTQRITMVRNSSVPVTVPIHKRPAGSESQETPKHTRTSIIREDDLDVNDKSHSGSHGRRSRARERTEKDKKTMLSKALQKANTAVLLDNAQNYEGALEAYGDACELLMQVMDRTSGDDDKRKLDAIRVTYSNRMEELQQLVQERPSAPEEKILPARPMSDDSPSPKSPGAVPIDGTRRASFTDTPTMRATTDVPRLSYHHNDRDSFFERTMQAVENSASFDSDSQHASFTTGSTGAGAEDEDSDELSKQASIHLPPPEHSQYVPRPLSPKRSDIPKPLSGTSRQEQQVERDGESESARDRTDTGDSTSWLDTIDESGSSCSDSVHSLDDLQGMRRKHIRGTSGHTDPDFDAAFDAAVEAAYNEGLEPDLDARQKRMTSLQHRQNDSIQVPASAINEIFKGELQTTESRNLDPDEEEEERILDEITLDYGRGFNFDLQSKSALPRQSDSSGYSRSTWQSSQVSDRATAATSLSTVAEDGLADHLSKPGAGVATTRLRGESAALPPPTAPPSSALPQPPSLGGNRSSVRARRLSGLNQKQLKIETSPQPPEARKRASTFHHTASPFAEDDELQSARERKASFGDTPLPTASDVQHDKILQSPPSLEFQSGLDEMSKPLVEEPTIDLRPSYEEIPAERPASRPTLFRKNKSSVSLRDYTEHTVLLQSPDQEHGPSLITPMSSTFMSFAAAKRNQNPLTSQRANLPSLAQSSFESSQVGGGIHLFDTSLSVSQPPISPRSPIPQPFPSALEPCPEPFLLRPFWLMRALSQTITHPKGGFLSTKLFVPREVWYTRGVKLKLVEDKVANSDLLTAALGRLAGVDTYDADAVMDELQSFEEVMERVQATLAKKLGSDVGVHGVAGMFKDASAATMASATANAHGSENASSDKATKSNSGKSYLSSWRKLRNKSSGTPLSSGSTQTSAKTTEKEQHTMPSVPMTNYVPIERRGNKKDARNLAFGGPNKEYMGSLARLFDSVQVLDQIARQVEDPGLKHSSPTHVGLELSIRHAAEFFGFYICRFVLADLSLLLDKFLKRGTEWVLA